MGSQIDFNAPQFLTWWKRNKKGGNGTHQTFAREYNDTWENWLREHPNATENQILDFARQTAEAYKSQYYKERYYFELYQQAGTAASPY